MIMGLAFLAFTIYQNTSMVDPEELLYLLLSVTFSSAALSFNRASTYAGFLGQAPTLLRLGESSSQFSKSMHKEHADIVEKEFLLEVKVNVPYERVVEDFCAEFLSQGGMVFAVTTKSSVLYRVALKIQRNTLLPFLEQRFETDARREGQGPNYGSAR